MKQWVFILSMAGLVYTAGAGVHAFTTQDGRALEAEIISCRPERNQVVLQRADRKRIPVKIDVFSDEDQAYIRAWCAADLFKNSSMLKMTVEKELVNESEEEKEGSVSGRRGGGGGGGGGGDRDDASDEPETIKIKTSEYQYTLLLENRAGTDFSGLTVEYRIFYEQERMGRGEPSDNDGDSDGGPEGRGGGGRGGKDRKAVAEARVAGGNGMVDALPDKENGVYVTDPVKITERSGGPVKLRGKLVGVWFKVRCTGPDGDQVERNVCLPAGISEKYSWADVTPEREEGDRPVRGGRGRRDQDA